MQSSWQSAHLVVPSSVGCMHGRGHWQRRHGHFIGHVQVGCSHDVRFWLGVVTYAPRRNPDFRQSHLFRLLAGSVVGCGGGCTCKSGADAMSVASGVGWFELLCRLAAPGVITQPGVLWVVVSMVVLVFVGVCEACGRLLACPRVVALGRGCRGWRLAMVVCFCVV